MWEHESPLIRTHNKFLKVFCSRDIFLNNIISWWPRCVPLDFYAFLILTLNGGNDLQNQRHCWFRWPWWLYELIYSLIDFLDSILRRIGICLPFGDIFGLIPILELISICPFQKLCFKNATCILFCEMTTDVPLGLTRQEDCSAEKT